MDAFHHPDYYQLDDLLSEEHKMVRDATRDWIKRSVSPIIEDYAQRAAFKIIWLKKWAKSVYSVLISQKNTAAQVWIT